MKLAIDAMGGDNAPACVVEGALAAIANNRLPKDVQLLLFGDEATLSSLIGDRDPDGRINIVATTQIIDCNEQPTLAIRRGKDSSMVKALNAVANGEADCFISAGSTGAILAGATLIVKRIKGVKRPALAPVMPTVKGGGVMILDAGANTDCKPSYLQQFALMGSSYMQNVVGIASPRVALLNNGAEEEKGKELTKTAHALIKQMQGDINFIGNIEPRDVMGGDADVVVCDGFDGNIVLKCTEGTASAITSMLKSELMSSFTTKIGALLAKKAFKNLKKRMDYTEYGGAPLLGINGGIIKAHGSSDSKAIMNAILQGEKLIRSNVTQLTSQSMGKYDFKD